MNIYIVDDDVGLQKTIQKMLEPMGHVVQCFSSGSEFLNEAESLKIGCVLLDLCMPDLDGLSVQGQLAEKGCDHAVILLTGFGDVPDAVAAMRVGAIDFMRKPFRRTELLDALSRAEDAINAKRQPVETSIDENKEITMTQLSPRERDVLLASANGASAKQAAHSLSLSVRTVEMYRSNIIKKLKVSNFGAAQLLALRLRMYDKVTK